MRMYAIVSQSVSLVVLPVSSRLAATMEMAKLRQRLVVVFASMMKALVPINVVAWLSAGYLLPLILGPAYYAAIPYFYILLFATFLEPFYSVLGNALVGIGKAETVVAPLLIGVALSVAGNLLVVQVLGIQGAPFVVVGAYLVLAVLVGRRAHRIIR